MRIVHAGSFFGQRTPRPFLSAFAALLRERPELRGRVQAAFLGELRPADREWALGLGLGDALALEGFRPHAEALAAMRAADVLLLLVPRAGGRGLSVVSGKVYEYLAAERPILALVPPEGDAAALLRDTGSAWIADPDDEGAILAALGQAAGAWEAGRLEERRLTPEWRERLDRRTRAARAGRAAARGGPTRGRGSVYKVRRQVRTRCDARMPESTETQHTRSRPCLAPPRPRGS